MISSIITHPGGAHKDDFLACAVLLKNNPVSIYRREPTKDDLKNNSIAVLDVGGVYEPECLNFDHHQFPRDHEPICSLSLVLKFLGIYDDAREFCPWLEVAEWFDCRGPNDTAEWLNMDRETLGKLNSPLDITMLKSFADRNEHHLGEPVWEIMRMIGSDLVDFITSIRSRLDIVSKYTEVWEEINEDKRFKVLFLPRVDDLPEDASGVLGYQVKALGLEEEIISVISPDSRGEGYGMRRYNDDKRMDFSRLEDEPDVHFAHSRGFIAKTTTTEINRLKSLIRKAFVV